MADDTRAKRDAGKRATGTRGRTAKQAPRTSTPPPRRTKAQESDVLSDDGTSQPRRTASVRARKPPVPRATSNVPTESKTNDQAKRAATAAKKPPVERKVSKQPAKPTKAKGRAPPPVSVPRHRRKPSSSVPSSPKSKVAVREALLGPSSVLQSQVKVVTRKRAAGTAAKAPAAQPPPVPPASSSAVRTPSAVVSPSTKPAVAPASPPLVPSSSSSLAETEAALLREAARQREAEALRQREQEAVRQREAALARERALLKEIERETALAVTAPLLATPASIVKATIRRSIAGRPDEEDEEEEEEEAAHEEPAALPVYEPIVMRGPRGRSETVQPSTNTLKTASRGKAGASRMAAKLKAQDRKARHIEQEVPAAVASSPPANSVIRNPIAPPPSMAQELMEGSFRPKQRKRSLSFGDAKQFKELLSKQRFQHISIADEPTLLATLKDLANRKTDCKWVLLQTAPFGEVSICCTGALGGQAGLDEVKPHLPIDAVRFLFFNMSSEASVDYAGCKIALVVWVGDHAKGVLKAKSAPQRADLRQFAQTAFTTTGEVVVTDLEDLTVGNILKHLHGASGKIGAASTNLDEEAKAALDEQQRQRYRMSVAEQTKARYALVGRTDEHLEFEGKQALQQALARVWPPLEEEEQQQGAEDKENKRETEDADYVAAAVDGEQRKVVVEKSGKGALTEQWNREFLDPEKVYVFVMKVVGAEGGYGSLNKTLFVFWIGERVSVKETAKARELHQSLLATVRKVVPISGDMEARNASEITSDVALMKVSGTRVRGETISSGKSDKFKGFGRKGKSELTFEESEALVDTIKSMILRSEHREGEHIPAPAWIAMTYVPDKPDVMRMIESGFEDSLLYDTPGYHKHCVPTATVFIFHRVMVVPPHLQTAKESRFLSPYYGFIFWQGAEVETMQKALSSHHWNAFTHKVKDVLALNAAAVQPGHLRASDVMDLGPDSVRAAMRIKD